MYYGSPSNFANIFRAFSCILDIHEESVHTTYSPNLVFSNTIYKTANRGITLPDNLFYSHFCTGTQSH